MLQRIPRGCPVVELNKYEPDVYPEMDHYVSRLWISKRTIVALYAD
jgi:hypothetical protein